jgi:hypothetical protein
LSWKLRLIQWSYSFALMSVSLSAYFRPYHTHRWCCILLVPSFRSHSSSAEGSWSFYQLGDWRMWSVMATFF